MRRHEMTIHPVLRVAIAVVVERVRFIALMVAHRRQLGFGAAAVFVDVVAGVEDEVERLVGDVRERREEPVLVVIAAADGESQAIDGGAQWWRRSGASDGTHVRAGMKAIEVLAARPQTLDFDVHAVTEFGSGVGRAAPDDGAKERVVGQFPADPDGAGCDAAAIQRIGRQPRPQHDATR